MHRQGKPGFDSRRKRAIDAMIEARNIHQDWVDQLREKNPYYVRSREIGGTIKWHERWVRIYDLVIRELQK